MRLANASGRAALVVDGTVVDLERASAGRLPSDPMAALARWDEIRDFSADVGPDDAAPLDGTRLGPPVPGPQKVFGIALNYRPHAEESGMALPEAPSVFTKFPSCLAGPADDIVLPSAAVDWEVELVVVIGRAGRRIPEERALEHVAGYCVGQDISERRVQLAGDRPQFSLGKSFDSFGPIGPAVVSLDEIPDPHDLALRCEVSGEVVQDGRTRDLIFPVPALIAYLSRICTLAAGDLIFTGTPDGVGVARRPPRFLQPTDVVVSTIEHLGTMTNRCVAEEEVTST